MAQDDFREGLTAIISVKVAEPQFEGQTKTKLGNSEVNGAVQKAVGEAMTNYLEEHPKEAHTICEKVILAATARIAARKARESVQRKSPMTGGGLPGKLADCSNKDPKNCEIFLVEGDSAGGSAKQGRARHFQAILPLRGKILNVEKVQWHRVFEAESVMNIIQSIGVRFGVDGEGDKEANIDKLRYDKIIIMTDADVDGSHIDTLIMTLFYRFMPRIIQDGHLYIATPPLYKCTYKKVSEYCYTEQQRQAFIDKYVEGNGEAKGLHTQRYKGLGEMNAQQLWDTTMDPKTRKIIQVTMNNVPEAIKWAGILLGDDDIKNAVRNNVEYISRMIQHAGENFEHAEPDFEECCVNEFLHNYTNTCKDFSFTTFDVVYDTTVDDDTTIDICVDMFTYLFDTILDNAYRHGFEEKKVKDAALQISAHPTSIDGEPYILLSIANNGKPFSNDFSVEKFISRGEKCGNTGHHGLGGNHIYHIIKKHNGYLNITGSSVWPVVYEILIPVKNSNSVDAVAPANPGTMIFP